MEQRKYELLLIFSLKHNDTIETAKEMAKNIVKQHNFAIASEDEMGRRLLAYPIMKEKEGFYYIYYIEPKKDADSESMMQSFRREKGILRPLLFAQDEKKLKNLREKTDKFMKRKMELEKRRTSLEKSASKESFSEDDFVSKEAETNG